MLEDDDVTSSADGLFEAIGPFLEQVDDSKTEEDIKEICDRLYHLVAKEWVVFFKFIVILQRKTKSENMIV